MRNSLYARSTFFGGPEIGKGHNRFTASKHGHKDPPFDKKVLLPHKEDLNPRATFKQVQEIAKEVVEKFFFADFSWRFGCKRYLFAHREAVIEREQSHPIFGRGKWPAIHAKVLADIAAPGSDYDARRAESPERNKLSQVSDEAWEEREVFLTCQKPLFLRGLFSAQ
jgi:hypothetical protein